MRPANATAALSRCNRYNVADAMPGYGALPYTHCSSVHTCFAHSRDRTASSAFLAAAASSSAFLAAATAFSAFLAASSSSLAFLAAAAASSAFLAAAASSSASLAASS